MKQVRLTKGLYAIVDDEDYERLNQHRWRCMVGYATRTKLSPRRGGKRKSVQLLMHRQILGLIAGDGVVVDHISGNTLDNRRENLRRGTQSQNMANRGPTKSNTSGLKGVSFDQSRGKWIAMIGINGKQKNLGRFMDRDDAAAAYQQAAISIFGEFARRT